jgi:tRNA pseudouridine38-40 synthase
VNGSEQNGPVRIAACVEYDGSGFCGWQHQRGEHTVQDCVEHAFSVVADHPVRVICAGRTDTGVHATAQVVHFETTARRSERSWVLGANSNLPDEVAVNWAQPVPADFHARFSARERSYRYVILNRWVRSGLLRGRTTWVHRPLDVGRMAEGAASLIGEHDFSSFRALACQSKSPIRELRELRVTRRGEFVLIDVAANAFLHHMVRNIAGVLIAVGSGDRSPAWVVQLLAARDRTVGGVTAPPHGLYLVRVAYDPALGLPDEQRLPPYGADHDDPKP